jgi:hypothetical protein
MRLLAVLAAARSPTIPSRTLLDRRVQTVALLLLNGWDRSPDNCVAVRQARDEDVLTDQRVE